MLPVEGSNHPGYCMQVWAISVARSRSYVPLKFINPRRSTNYARDASMRIMYWQQRRSKNVFLFLEQDRLKHRDGIGVRFLMGAKNNSKVLHTMWWVNFVLSDMHGLKVCAVMSRYISVRPNWLVLYHLAGYVIASSVKITRCR